MTSPWLLLQDKRGSGSVQMLVLLVALALGGVAGVAGLRQALDSRSDCAGDQIRTLGAAPCGGAGGGGVPAALGLPLVPTGDEGGDPTGPIEDITPAAPADRGDSGRQDPAADRPSGPRFALGFGGIDLPEIPGPIDDIVENTVAVPPIIGGGGELAERAGGVLRDVIDDSPGDGGGGGFLDDLGDAAGDFIDAVNPVPEILEEGRDFAIDQILDPLNLEDIGDLDAGDSLTLGANLEASAGLTVQGDASIEVTRTEDGRFVVTVAGGVQVGVGIKFLDLLGGPNGSVELTFDTAEQAQAAVEDLVRIPLLGTPAAFLGPTPGELGALLDDVSAVELGSSATAQVDGLLGITNFDGGGAEGELGLNRGARIEFEDGRPSAIVATFGVSASGAAEISDNRVLERALGLDLPDVNARAEASGSLEVELRRPIRESPDGDPVEQISEILTNPGSVELGPLTGGIRADAEVEFNDRGADLGLQVDGLTADDARTFVERLNQGDVEGAIAGTGRPVVGTFNTFEESGPDHEIDVGVGSFGVEDTTRTVGNTHEVTLQPDASGRDLDVFVDGQQVPIGDVLSAFGLGG